MTQNKSYDANTLFAAIAIIPFLVPNGLQTFSFMRIVYDLKYLISKYGFDTNYIYIIYDYITVI